MSTFNLDCEKFKQEMINTINNSKLPIAVVYYIFQSIGKDLENTYYGTLNSETVEREKELTQKLGKDDNECQA